MGDYRRNWTVSRGQAKSDGPKYKVEEPQEASLNIESANQSRHLQGEVEEKSETEWQPKLKTNQRLKI